MRAVLYGSLAAVLGTFFWSAASAVPAAPSGSELFNRRCASCHNHERGEPDKLGPNLACVKGRSAGARPGFAYSEAVRKSGIRWSNDNLDAFLAKPRAFLPGNRMMFAGLTDPIERRKIITVLDTCEGRQ